MIPKLIWRTETINGKWVMVFHRKGEDSYVVRFYADGRHMDAGDEYYVDRAEAISRANHVMEAERSRRSQGRGQGRGVGRMTHAETIYQLLGGGSPTSLTKLQAESQRLDTGVQRDSDGDDHYLHFSDGSVLGVRYRRRSPNRKNQLWIAGVPHVPEP